MTCNLMTVLLPLCVGIVVLLIPTKKLMSVIVAVAALKTSCVSWFIRDVTSFSLTGLMCLGDIRRLVL